MTVLNQNLSFEFFDMLITGSGKIQECGHLLEFVSLYLVTIYTYCNTQENRVVSHQPILDVDTILSKFIKDGSFREIVYQMSCLHK